MSATDHPMDFAFRFTPGYRAAARPFGITPRRTSITVDSSELAVRFGPWRARTELSNIESITRTGPFGFLKTAGPAHLGLTDHGLTFATNGDRGVCMTFHDPIAGIEPTGLLRHPELTLTVDDVDGFIGALAEHGVSVA